MICLITYGAFFFKKKKKKKKKTYLRGTLVYLFFISKCVTTFTFTSQINMV